MGSPNNRDLKLVRPYCDGVTAQKNGELITADPWRPAGADPQVPFSQAWLQGWGDAEQNVTDLSCCGYPKAGDPPPEIFAGDRY